MKNQSVIFLLFSTFLLFSCKEAEKTEDSPKAVKEIKLNVFDVELDVTSTEKNMIILYYLDGTSPWFTPEQTVWMGVEPKAESQTIVLSLPEGVPPTDLRLNYGFDKLKGPIQINEIRLKYQDKQFTIDKKSFEEYFTPNQYIKFDSATLLATPITVDGKMDPFFVSKPKLAMAIDKLIHGA